MKRPVNKKICIGCGKRFKFKAFRTEIKKRKYCTRVCANKHNAIKQAITKRGVGNPMYGKRPVNFKGRKLSVDGYWLVYAPNHPYCQKTKFILEHRLVMEKKIGRYLRPEEVVHHIDGNKKNNKINNLKLFKNENEHRKHHRKKKGE